MLYHLWITVGKGGGGSDCLGSFYIYLPKSQEIGHVTIFPTVPYGPGLVGHEFTTKFISYF